MKPKDPEFLALNPDPFGTVEDWWSARYATEALSEPVLEQARRLRESLNLHRDEHFWGDDPVEALRRSALDYLEDAQAAINAYRSEVNLQLDYWPDDTDDAAVLLKIYGLLQAFILQQDAARMLWRSLGGPQREWWSDYPDLQYIRWARNAAGGHPCDLNTSYGKSHQVIHRDRLSLRNFDMSSQSDDGGGSFGAVKPDCMIVEQALSMARLLSDTVGLLTGDVVDSAVGWRRPWEE